MRGPASLVEAARAQAQRPASSLGSKRLWGWTEGHPSVSHVQTLEARSLLRYAIGNSKFGAWICMVTHFQLLEGVKKVMLEFTCAQDTACAEAPPLPQTPC